MNRAEEERTKEESSDVISAPRGRESSRNRADCCCAMFKQSDISARALANKNFLLMYINMRIREEKSSGDLF